MNEIDNRIVSMEFDNKQFESGIQTSIKSLKNLDDALVFKHGKTGFQEIEDSARSVDLSPLSDAIDNIESRFSVLGIIGDQVIRNLTNSAMNMATTLSNAVFIEPVGSGFEEYETQMKSIQTILANTKSKGTTLEQVNEALDDLNYYADKTIYNFTQMTQNIGRFTAAGVDLDTSKTAIKGIANLAATSGATAQQTSTAMYQLSQALAAGSVKLQDWNSVVNANMGGEIFQNSLLETARVHGIAVDKMVAKTGSFRESLKKGWLTTAILTETLEKFTESYEDLTDAELDARIQYWKNKGYTDAQIQGIFELGQTATDAATKVRTFTQLFDTLKEAMQSGWTMSWRYIIGDFDEATELLTGISDEFSSIINAAADARNAILQAWHDSGGRDLFIAALQNIYTIFKGIGDIGHQIWTSIFPPLTGETLTNITAGFFTVTDIIREALGFTNDFGKTVSEVFSEATDVIDESVSQITGSVDSGVTKNEEKAKELYSKMPEWMQKWVQVSGSSELARVANWRTSNQEKWYEYWEAVTGQDMSADRQIASIYSQMPEWMRNWVAKNGSKDLERIKDWSPKNQALWNSYWDAIAQKAQNATQSANEYADAISGADGTGDGGAVEKLNLLEKLLLAAATVADVVKGALSALATGGIRLLTVTLAPLIQVISSVAGSFLDWVIRMANALKATDAFSNAVTKIVDALSPLGSVFASIVSYIAEFWKALWAGGLGNGIKSALTGVFGGLMLVVYGVTTLISKIKDYIASSELVQNGLNEIKNIASGIGGFISSAVQAVRDLASALGGYLKKSELFKEFGNDLKSAFEGVLQKISGIYTKIKNFVSGIREAFFGKTEVTDENAIAPTFYEKLVKVIDRIKNVVQKVKDFVKELIPEDIRNRVSEFLNGLLPVKAIKSFLAGLKGLNAVEIYRKIKDFFKNLNITDLVSKGLERIKSLDFKAIWGKLADFIKSLNPLESIQKILSKFSLDGILDFFQGLPAIQKIKGAFDTFINWIGKAFPDLKSKVLDKITPILGILTIGFKWIGEQLKNLYEYIFGGGLFGVIKMLYKGFVLFKFLNVIKNITDVFKGPTDALGDLAEGFNNMAEAFKAKVKNIGTTVLKIAVGVGILVAALWVLAKMDPESFRSAMFGLVAILGVVTLFIKELGRTSENGAGANKVGTAILKMSVAVALLVRSMKKISEMDLPSLRKGLVGLFAMIKVITSGMKQKAGTQSMTASAGTLIGMAIAVRLMIKAVDELSQMNIDELIKGLGSLWVIVRTITASLSKTMQVLDRGQKYKGAGLLSYVGLAAAVWMLAQSVSQLGKMDLGVIAQGLIAIRVLMGGIAKVMTASAETKFTNGMAMLAMGAAVQMFVAAMSKIGEMDVWSLIKSLVGIRILIRGMTEMANSIKGGTFKLGQTFILLAAMAGSLFIFMKAMKGMKDFSGGQTLAITGSFAAVLLSLSKSLKVLSKISLAGAAKATGILLGVMAVIGVIGYALGTLIGEDGQNDIVDKLDRAAEVTGAIGNVIGSFFTNLFGPIGRGLTGAMASIPTGLSTFMDNLQPFLEKVKNVDGSVLSGITNLAAASLAITGAGFVEGLASALTKWMIGKTTAQAMMDSLNVVASGVVTLQRHSRNIDQAKLDVVSTAISTVGDMVKEHIPEQSFWDNVAFAITGVSDLTVFAEGLGALGTAIGTYSAAIQNVDADKITNSTPAIQGLVDVADAIPDNGIIENMIAAKTGISDMTTFAKSLGSLGTAVSGYITSLGGRTNYTSITSSTEAIRGLVEVADAVPKEGLLDKKLNATNFGAFIRDLSNLGRPLKIFSIASRGFKEADVTTTGYAASMLQSIVEVANTVPKEGLLDKKLNATNFGAFIKDLASLKDPLRAYVNTFTGRNAISDAVKEQSKNATDIFASIVEVANAVPEQGFLDKFFNKTDMEAFMDGLSSLGGGISGYVSATSGITEADVEKVGNSTGVIRAFIQQMQSATSDTNGDSLRKSFMEMFYGIDDFNIVDYGAKLAQFGRDIGTFAYYLGDHAGNNLNEAITNAEQSLPRITALFAQDNVSGDYDIFSSLLLNMTTILTNSLPAFYDAGKSLVSEVVRGETDATPTITDTSVKLASNATQAVSNTYPGLFYNIGMNVAMGFANGIQDHAYLAANAAAAMAARTATATRNQLSIHSPSRVFGDIAMYCMRGFANGFANYGILAEDSVSDMADRVTSIAQYALAGINDVLDSDDQLVITPVLDLTNVQSGIHSIDSLLGAKKNLGVTTNELVGGVTARNVERTAAQINQNGSDFSGIISAISSVNDRIDSLGEKMASMQVVLNSGALVGQIAGEMDRNLGQRTILKGRGN